MLILTGLQVVGVVVCNMRDSNNITFPNVNLAIPTPTIATILNKFLKTGGKVYPLECAVISYDPVFIPTSYGYWILTERSIP